MTERSLRRLRLIAAISAVALSTRLARCAAPFPDGLRPGPFRVGYASEVLSDPSRTGFSGTPGRPVHLQMWYPAIESGIEPVTRRRYIEDEARLEDARRPGPAEVERAADRWIAQHGAAGASRRDFDALFAQRTPAVPAAPFASGPFPLVLYFHTGALEKSIQCEFLASRGFVVVSASVAGTFEPELEVAASGAETEARDLEVAESWAFRTAPLIPNSVGVVGMSFGGISELVFAARHPETRAIVSLDGGGGSASGAATIEASPFFDVVRVRAPILHEFSPEGADLEFLESLRYSDRTFAKFPGLHHRDFSGSGILTDFARSSPAAERARAGVNRLMAEFLRSHLLAGKPTDGEPAAPAEPGEEIRRLARVPEPPLTFEELRAIVRSRGVGVVAEEAERRKAQDPRPLSEETFRKLGSWLFDEGRAWDARRLFELQAAMYPQSARARFFSAIACRATGDADGARDKFREALALLPTDPGMDGPTRRRIEKTARTP